MALELRAYSPVDGWAIAVDGGDPYLIRPPYRLEQREGLSAAETAQAVKQLDLQAAEASFTGWRELIEFLTEEMVRTSDPELLEQATAASRSVLANASADDLHRHLDLQESRLASGDWRGTWKALNVLIGLEKVIDDVALFERCRLLLDRCAKAEDRQLKTRTRVRQRSGGSRTWFGHVGTRYLLRTVEEMSLRMARSRQVLRIVP